MQDIHQEPREAHANSKVSLSHQQISDLDQLYFYTFIFDYVFLQMDVPGPGYSIRILHRTGTFPELKVQFSCWEKNVRRQISLYYNPLSLDSERIFKQSK
jgi:hypothetical protein